MFVNGCLQLQCRAVFGMTVFEANNEIKLNCQNNTLFSNIAASI